MIKVEEISHRIGNKQLLKNINFEVKNGEFLTIIGPNGAGKSTLMKCLCKDFKPSTGKITFFGKELNSFKSQDLAKIRSVLTQSNHVSINYKVNELISMGRYPHYENNMSEHDIAIVQQVMQDLGIEHFYDRQYYSLSGGEQQRVQLARVLAQIYDQENAVLFLDEPINGLDLLYQQAILSQARKLADRGHIIISILHDINFASRYADKVLILNKGEIVAFGKCTDTISEKNISETYQTPVKLIQLPDMDYPLIVPISN